MGVIASLTQLWMQNFFSCIGLGHERGHTGRIALIYLCVVCFAKPCAVKCQDSQRDMRWADYPRVGDIRHARS